MEVFIGVGKGNIAISGCYETVNSVDFHQTSSLVACRIEENT